MKIKIVYLLGTFILLFIAGFFFDVKALISQHEIEVQLKNKFEKETKTQKKLLMPKKNEELLPVILAVAEKNGLIIQAIYPEEDQHFLGLSLHRIHCVLQGNFFQWANFLLECQAEAWIDIDALSIMKKSGQLEIDVTLTGVRRNVSTHFISLPKTFDPFANENSQNLLKLTDALPLSNSLQTISLNQFRYQGFVKFGDVKFAILRLPTGETELVRPGMILGLEKALIIDIDENKIKLKNNKVCLVGTLRFAHPTFN